MLSCQAAAHGSSFKPAGPGCGESGITAVQHQQKEKTNLQTHTHTHRAFQSVKEESLSVTIQHANAK